MLVPIDQYKKGSSQPKASKLKFLPPKVKAPVQRPDIRQSDNYKNAVLNVDRYSQEATKAASFGGMLKNSLKAAPQAIADTLVGTPAKFIASAIEAPEVAYKRNYTDRTYKVPGLTPFKSFQSDYGKVADEVISGKEFVNRKGETYKKGLGSAAWELAKVPLAGLETGVGAGGIAKGIGLLSKGNIKGAGAVVSDAFLPTNFSKGLKPLPPKATPNKVADIETSVVQRINPSTNALEYQVIPKGQLESFHNAIDSPQGGNIAGKNIDGWQYHLTAKSPEQMEASGFKNTGVADLNKIPKGDNIPSEINSDVVSISQKLDGVKPTGKERGFIESVKNSPEVSQDLASRVQGTYEPTTNKAGLEKAQRTIFDNISEAERIAKDDVGAEGGLMNTELIKHYDSIAQKAKQAGDEDTFNQAMDKAVEVAESRAKNLTQTAQNLQAASTISKLSPEGLLHYINKVSKDIDSPVRLSNDATYDFMRRAGEIQQILDPREKAFKTFDLIDDLAEQMPRGKKDKFLEALNLPRAIMSTGDLSAPLRQGIFTAARNPITFGKNFGKMFKYAFSEDAYRGLKADIITSPNYNLYVKHGLPLTDVSAGLTGREEAFMSNLAEKIPFFGKLAKGSNRAYTGFLNKMRVDLFDDFVKTAELNGIKSEKYFEDAAKFVGAATGRGNLFKTLEGSAPALNSIFFSPRLMASRLSLINPAFYMKLDPTVRKEALKSLGAFVGTGISILALAKANGAEVSADPRSADFGKIKNGNTRYDIWGGFQQYARLIGQLSTGEKVSTITGKETTLGQGYNAPTRESIFMDFLKSKEAPIISLLTRASQGEKYGEKFNLPAEVIDRFLPMVTSDAFDLYKEYGAKGVAGAIPGFFGVGSQTYGDQIPTMGTTESNNPTVKWRTQPGLGETILNKATGNEISNIPKEQWDALYQERKQEQIRQAEVDKQKAIVLISGEPQYVGDTKIYLENGVVKTKKESKDKRMPMKDQLLYEEIQNRKTNPFYTK